MTVASAAPGPPRSFPLPTNALRSAGDCCSGPLETLRKRHSHAPTTMMRMALIRPRMLLRYTNWASSPPFCP